MKNFWKSLNKFSLLNISIVAAFFLSAALMFLVQFKVDVLQDDIANAQSDIANYTDEIKILDLEWVYLTRPERLRTLAAQYLQNNDYTLVKQIKDEGVLESYLEI